jgi:hypothetical protein
MAIKGDLFKKWRFLVFGLGVKEVQAVHTAVLLHGPVVFFLAGPVCCF